MAIKHPHSKKEAKTRTMPTGANRARRRKSKRNQQTGFKQWLYRKIFRRQEPPKNEALYLMTETQPKSTLSESFRFLRTNIQFYSIDEKVRCILVTSSGPGEGKSFTASNLAITMAHQGYKTLLVDADMRKPVQHRNYGVSRLKGLSTVITGNCTLEQAIHTTKVNNLSLMPSGPTPPNPAELLGSKALEEIMVVLHQQFDVIVLDTPPSLVVADAAILARLSDGVVLVARSGFTNKQALVQAKNRLKSTKSKILGVVLNDCNMAEGEYNYYYYYYYNNYYYYREEGDND